MFEAIQMEVRTGLRLRIDFQGTNYVATLEGPDGVVAAQAVSESILQALANLNERLRRRNVLCMTGRAQRQ